MGSYFSKYNSKKRFSWTSSSPTVSLNLHNGMSPNSARFDDCESTTTDIGLSPLAQSLYRAALQNSSEQILAIVKEDVDINMSLNEKCETALILAVKMCNMEAVECLLRVPGINVNCYNIHCCSVLDIALITAFESRSVPQYDMCWEILCKLMANDVEPLSKDAMTYVLRTALRDADDAFITRFISAAVAHSTSIKLHLYFVEKLHRQQPIYPGDMDAILELATTFTIHLLRCANEFMLRSIVHSLIFYIESHWRCRRAKCAAFTALVVLATGAGWLWTTQQLQHIEKVQTDLAFWCCNQRFTPPSLMHLSRVQYRRCVQRSVDHSLARLSFRLPEKIKSYILLHDLDSVPSDIMSLHL